MTSIGLRAYASCAVVELNIPDSVTLISGYAFEDCERLEKVVISGSDIYITVYAFRNCHNIKEMYYEGILPARGEWLSDIPAQTKLYVPKDYIEEYKEAWPGYAPQIVGYDFTE